MISKILSKIKEKGILYIVKAILFKIGSILKKILFKIFYKKNKTLKSILNYKRVIVFENYFGFNKILMQRPQHMAKSLADSETFFIYSSLHPEDYKKSKVINSLTENLHIFNLYICRDLIFSLLKNTDIAKYVMVYSTDNIEEKLLRKYKEQKFKIIYEYVDDINEELIDKSIIESIKRKHENLLKKADVVVCTANKLYDNAKAVSKNSVVLINNGVDYNHFANPGECTKSHGFQKIVDEKKPIIGYYGALASWFDYEMVKHLAKERPGYNIVFFGIKYDNSYEINNLNDYSNIYYLGKISYNELPAYASHFSVCTIPFVLNEITEATSPVKLFEYMAMAKPIVTTDMNECRNYKSVMIAKNNDEFVELIDKAVSLNNDKTYLEILKKEALENTWDSKADKLKKVLEQ